MGDSAIILEVAFAFAGFIFGERPQKTTITPSAPILSLPKTEVAAELRNRTEIGLLFQC